MRILITGYTTRMFGSDRVQGDYVTFSLVLERILRGMGHQVERRKVKIGDEIAGVYNYAFCGVAPLSSMTSGQVPQTHYVMDMMTNRHCVYADDWSFCNYGNSVRYTLDRWGKYLDYKKFSCDFEQLDMLRGSLDNMMSMTLAGNNAPVLCPMFPWGDHSFLMKGNYNANLITVDPSAWIRYPTVDVYPRGVRTTQWVNAALSDHSSWIRKQGFNFPIYHVGNKRQENAIVLPESEVVKLFGRSFGVISVGYPSAGSGWWRSRYLNAAWAETPIYSDVLDQAIMGEAYRGSSATFEAELHRDAWNQRVRGQIDWLEKSISRKDEVESRLQGMMDA
jgi:hypothetical protein